MRQSWYFETPCIVSSDIGVISIQQPVQIWFQKQWPEQCLKPVSHWLY